MTGPLPAQVGAPDYNSQANADDFAVRMALARVRTAVDVIVVAVHAGAQPDQFTVDVTPLVNMVDGAGQSQQHGIILGIPVFTLSGANGSLCVQPAVNDLGVMLVCDRDHSAAIASQGIANPGSNRTHDLADGIYLGGFGALNANSRRIVMGPSGIVITGNVSITGNLAITGASTATGNVTAGQGTGDQVDLLNHTHQYQQPTGASVPAQTLAPTAGT